MGVETVDLPIADTPSGLTPQWLTRALRVGGHLDGSSRVVSAAVEMIGTGQMSRNARIHLTC